MMVSAHPSGPGLPGPGDAPAEPLLAPWAGLIGVVALALAAAVVLIQTRPAELRALPASLSPPAAGAGASGTPSPAAAPRPRFSAPDLHPTPPRVPALVGARPGGPPPLSFDLPRPSGRHAALPPPPPPGAGAGGALQGAYGTQPACAQCGWVESVQPLAAGSGGLSAGATVAAGAALGAQAGAAYGSGNGNTRGAASNGGIGTGSAYASGRPAGQAAAAAAGAVLGAEAAARQTGAGGRPRNGYEIHIRMEDGSPRVFEQAEPLPLGASVVVEGGVARLAPSRASTSTSTSTSTPSGGKVYGTD